MIAVRLFALKEQTADLWQAEYLHPDGKQG